jgi:putative MATE family efflux protein
MPARRDNYTFLTTAPVGKVILTMAVPTIISMLVTSIYSIVDTFYVGKISTQATAAVGIVFPVQAVIQAFGFYFGQGSGTYISRKLGSKEVNDARIMASTAFFASLAFGFLMFILGEIFLDPLSVALGSTPTILPYTKDFMKYILVGAPFMTATMTMNNQIRFQGNAMYGMIGIIIGAILNIALVPFFAFYLNMGVAGAAIGTVIGQMVSFVVLLFMTFRGGNIRLSFRNMSFAKKYHFEIFKGGTPSLSRQGLASISTLLLNIVAGDYGDAAIAGMSIVTRITFVIFSIIIGIGQGFQPMCGFNYGARKFDRVRKGYFFSIEVGSAFLLVCGGLGFIYADDIVDVLRHDPAVVEVGAAALRWQIITFIFSCVITISNMTLQTSGRSVAANILAACRNGIIFIPLIIILPKYFGLLGVEMCQAVADVLSFIVAVPLMVHYFRTIDRAS